MPETPKDLTSISWARRKAAEAFASGLRHGDLLTAEEADEIREFRAFLHEALAHRGLQIQEEPSGFRVVRAPFTWEVDNSSSVHLAVVG